MCNKSVAQYTGRSDMLNRLKLLAYAPDDYEEPLRNDPGECKYYQWIKEFVSCLNECLLISDEYDLSGSPSPDLKRLSFSENEDDHLIPVPTMFMAPPPAPPP